MNRHDSKGDELFCANPTDDAARLELVPYIDADTDVIVSWYQRNWTALDNISSGRALLLQSKLEPLLRELCEKANNANLCPDLNVDQNDCPLMNEADGSFYMTAYFIANQIKDILR